MLLFAGGPHTWRAWGHLRQTWCRRLASGHCCCLAHLQSVLLLLPVPLSLACPGCPLRVQDFPALGAPPPAAAPMAAPAPVPAAKSVPPAAAAGNGSAWGNPWSSSSLKDRLARSSSGGSSGGWAGSAGPAAGPAQQAPQQGPQQAQQASIEEFEARSGLRAPGDGTPDASRRR